jgi:zinc transport system substrate-binding protein
MGRASGIRRRWAGLARALALGAGVVAAGASAGAETHIGSPGPRVVVSVAPLHALAAAVMEGIGTPYLLLRGASSPHDARLRPSDARALTRAEVVIWAGPALEGFLVKALKALAGDALAGKTRIVTLTEEAGLIRLPLPGSSADSGPSTGPSTGPGRIDPHLWLDPANARRMAAIFAAVLAEADPDNGAVYRANATDLAARLDALDAELRRRLTPLRGVPYMVFHDAFAYFQARYGLNRIGAVTRNPEIRPGARHLAALRRRIREEGVVCVFTEPQFNPALVEALTEGTGARVATLDPLGVALGVAPGTGAEAYFVLMRALAAAVADCLEGG